MRPDSDVDLLVVRPDHLDPDDETWRRHLDQVASAGANWTGNDAQILEYSAIEVAKAQRSKAERVLRDIAGADVVCCARSRLTPRRP